MPIQKFRKKIPNKIKLTLNLFIKKIYFLIQCIFMITLINILSLGVNSDLVKYCYSMPSALEPNLRAKYFLQQPRKFLREATPLAL